MRRLPPLVPALVFSITLSLSCGSTVSLTGTPGSVGNATLGNPVISSPSAGRVNGQQSRGSGIGGSKAFDGPSNSGSVSQAAGGPQSTSTLGTGAATPFGIGHGVTSTTILLGLTYSDLTGSPFGERTGAADWQGETNALVNYINRHGGVAHRKLEVIFRSVKQTDVAVNIDEQAQATCTYFTQDNHVFAVIDLYATVLLSIKCLSAAGTIEVSDFAPYDSQIYATYPATYYSPGSLNMNRGLAVMVAGLNRRHFFAGAKVGVIRGDSPPYDRAYTTLVQSLRSVGVSVADQFETSTSDVGKISSDMQSAVLQFRTRQINRVLFIDYEGILAYEFMNSAQSQAYFPDYGLNSNGNFPSLSQLAPAAQLGNATGISWETSDTPTADAQPPSLPGGWHLCDQILRAAGYPTSPMHAYLCGGLFFVQSVLHDAASPSLPGFQRSAESFGTSFTDANDWATRFGPGIHDGAAAARTITFTTSCRCWRYAGPGPTVPY